jgi:hypothetical protein
VPRVPTLFAPTVPGLSDTVPSLLLDGPVVEVVPLAGRFAFSLTVMLPCSLVTGRRVTVPSRAGADALRRTRKPRALQGRPVACRVTLVIRMAAPPVEEVHTSATPAQKQSCCAVSISLAATSSFCILLR